jgi:hypothetical protein
MENVIGYTQFIGKGINGIIEKQEVLIEMEESEEDPVWQILKNNSLAITDYKKETGIATFMYRDEIPFSIFKDYHSSDCKPIYK